MDFNVNQAPEAQAFLNRLVALLKEPGVSLDPVLAPSLEQEAELREIFAQDRKNDRLANPYTGLLSIFEAPECTGIRSTRARVIKDEQDLAAQRIFPLSVEKRRKDGEPCVVKSLDDFQRNWSIFTEGSLVQLTNWNNVVAAGGSVLACLLPLSPKDGESRRSIRKFYHSAAYPTSDIDLFLWGLTPEQAEVKVNEIYEAVRDSVPWEVTCVRTKHAISIHSQYPYRSVQIVLRLYHSPAEILAGFDVDAPCVAYDGSRILANPRSIIALMRQANTVDITRRSPSYEIRLAKYASRGFEVLVPNLRRGDIDPTIFERSLNRISGLARLLVLEKLAKPEARVSYLESRRELRNRVKHNTIYTRRMRKQRKGDLKAEEEIAGLDMNDYDVASLHIPYGPGWTAKRIEKLVYQTDLGMNSTFNPKNEDRQLHRHVAFFGTMKECIEDLCEHCPEPRNEEEKTLQEEEDKLYIRGRISFIEDDPGRQSMTGSFNPIDEGEWSELAYLGPTEKLFAAIAAKDLEAVRQLLKSEDVDINRRDHVGRTALQVGALCGASNICLEFIDAGARMTARLPDGRTALHIAAQLNLSTVIEKMVLRSIQNEEKAKEDEAAKAKAEAERERKEQEEDADDAEEDEEDSELERPSSEDDWSSEEDEKDRKPMKKTKGDDAQKNQPDAEADIPEDNVELPDILDVNLPDWDLAFTPLDYAVVAGSSDAIQSLLNSGADPKAATKAKDYNANILHPLSLTILTSDDARAEEIIDQLIRAGASSAQADERLLSVFHTILLSGKTRLIEKILRSDPSANAALNVACTSDRLVFPLVSAIAKGFYSVVALLLGYGAKLNISAEDVQKVKNMVPDRSRGNWYGTPKTPHELDYLREIFTPSEMALAYQNYMLRLLVTLGAQVSIPCKYYFDSGSYYQDTRMSLVEVIGKQVAYLNREVDRLEEKKKSESDTVVEDINEDPKTFAGFRKALKSKVELLTRRKPDDDTYLDRIAKADQKRASEYKHASSFFQEMKALLESVGAKGYEQIFEKYPDAPRPAATLELEISYNIATTQTDRLEYRYINKTRWNRETVLTQLFEQYDALFDACWIGDTARVEELCLPRKSSKSGKAPIRITVEAHDNSGGAHNPFSVAIHARKWDTARAVLAIATAQYKPKEDNGSVAFTGQVILDEDESDSDSEADTVCDDDDSDLHESGGVGTITDLATRDSAVHCDTPPNVFFKEQLPTRLSNDTQKFIPSRSIVNQACLDGNLEAFVNICEMMQQLPEPEQLDMQCLRDVIICDSPELVDEIIRRTGLGIDLEELATPENDAQPIENLSKLYLGLTVHGKKRKDLAKNMAQDNRREENTTPLLWLAIQENSPKVIDYLSGSGPESAYQYFAKTKSTERAELLLRFHDLDRQLPKLLGIQQNTRGENALTAVIIMTAIPPKLDLAKKILSQFPAQKYLQSSIAYTGWTLLHLAAIQNVEHAFFDFLLSNGLSAEQPDKRGANIFHYVCRLGHTDLLKYFIRKLPKNVSSSLLKQTVRESGETPLMAAVLKGELAVVDVLLSSGLDAVKECLTIRDARGSMPIHAAVGAGYAKIVTSLLKAVPESDAIYSENGVGQTPLETAYIVWLNSATHENYPGNFLSFGHFNSMSYNTSVAPIIPNPDTLNKEVEQLKIVQANLLRDGKLAANTKLKDALNAFIPYLAEKAEAEAKFSATLEDEKPQEVRKDFCDRIGTLRAISEASSSSNRRSLVHLIDVQRSVQASLKKATRKVGLWDNGDAYDDYRSRRRFIKEEEIPDEVSAEVREKRDLWKGILGRSNNMREIFGAVYDA